MQLEHWLMADAREGCEGIFLMPDATPVRITGWEVEDDIRFGILESGDRLPFGEIRTADGRVFKLEDDGDNQPASG